MSRKLEKFIGDNRNEFDDALPSDKVWQNIAASFSGATKKKAVLAPFFKWSIAAAVFITAGTTTFLVFNKKTDTGVVKTTVTDTSSEAGNIPPEYEPQVSSFVKLVAMKQDELKALAPEQPELYRQFTTDINQLDSSYISLKNQLCVSPNREMLIEAMIQNLQLQLNVLNQQLSIINQIKQSKKV